jgi:uncharacterized protein with HEPN domain
MKQNREPFDYLEDILDAIKKAASFVGGMSFKEFSEDDKTAFAVIRALEIIGEATKNIPESFRNIHPEIPWRSMAGIRDKLIHDYIGINLKVVWKTATEDLPLLMFKFPKFLINNDFNSQITSGIQLDGISIFEN